MHTAIHATLRPLRLAAAVLAALHLPATDRDGYFSNQSPDGPVLLTLCEACASHGDVFFSLLDRPAGSHRQRPVPVLMRDGRRCQTLQPGQTAVLTMLPRAGGEPGPRSFHVTREGQPGCFRFTFRVTVQDGLWTPEVGPGEGAQAHADLTQADPDLLVFWGFRAQAD